MLYRLFKGCISILVVGFLGLQFPDRSIAQEVIPGEYIITFNQNNVARSRITTPRSLGLVELKHFDRLNISLYKSNTGRSLNKKAIKRLISSGEIKAIEQNIRVRALANPNDTHYPLLWGMNNSGQAVHGQTGTNDVDVDAPEAWNISTGKADVVVAVLDTGVLYSHPDLESNMWRNSGEIPGNGIDDDGNGIKDDVFGYNAIMESGDPKDDNGHGTHCAGTISGVGNNSIGVVGVGWNTKIMALKFLDASGSGSLADAIQGIQYAVKMKQRGVNIKVLSNSWGGSSYSVALESAISSTNGNGILFVAAAGNESNDNDASPTYPASYNVDNVIAVAALDNSGNLASSSNYGSNSVHIAAPGVYIYSTYLNNGYAYLSGTSMATPHVSGVAALLMGNQSLSPSQAKSKLMNTVKPLSSIGSNVKSGGIISAYRALTDSSIPPPPENNKINYSSSSEAYSWDTNLGNKISNLDDGYVSVNSSFNFPFYGSEYNRSAVSGNGRIQPLNSTENLPITDDFNTSVYKGISVYNMDLVPSTISSDGGIWAKDTGDSLIITWVSVPYDLISSGNPKKEIRVRAVLNRSGTINFVYNDTEVGNSNYDYGKVATVSLSPLSSSSGANLILSSSTENQTLIGNGKALSISSSRKAIFSDVDGDKKSDLVVWRPSNGMFFVSLSTSSYLRDSSISYQLGLPGDKPLIGDLDGDSKAEFIVYGPSTGTWYFRSSKSNYQEISSIQWGLPEDTPFTADVDADGVNDLGVYRPSASAFYVLLSSAGFNRSAAISGNTGAYKSVSLGGMGNDPVIGDANGDGADDVAVVWQLVGFWTAKKLDNTVIYSMPWGQPGDTPIYCNFDSDKMADRVIVRVEPNNALSWYTALASGAGMLDSFGSLGDIPSCKSDSDGDGIGDKTVFRNYSGMWYIKNSTDSNIKEYQFGLPGDIPLLY